MINIPTRGAVAAAETRKATLAANLTEKITTRLLEMKTHMIEGNMLSMVRILCLIFILVEQKENKAKEFVV